MFKSLYVNKPFLSDHSHQKRKDSLETRVVYIEIWILS